MVNVFIVIYLLDTHLPYCDRFDFQKVEYPKEGHNSFYNSKTHKTMRVPFAIYADFEASATKIDTCLPDPTTSSTTHQTKFDACGYAY